MLETPNLGRLDTKIVPMYLLANASNNIEEICVFIS